MYEPNRNNRIVLLIVFHFEILYTYPIGRMLQNNLAADTGSVLVTESAVERGEDTAGLKSTSF